MDTATLAANETSGDLLDRISGGVEGEDEEYLLQFKDYAHFLTSGVDSARNCDQFVDVSLLCGSSSSLLKAHRVILSACSPYFHSILSNPNLPNWQHPVLLLQDIPHQDLTDILTFVYLGKVSVHQHRFQSFLKSAQKLKIRGLTTNDVNNKKSASKRSLRTSNADDEHDQKRPKKASVVTATITAVNSPKNSQPAAAGTNNKEDGVVVKNEPVDAEEEEDDQTSKSDKEKTVPSEHLVIPADPTLVQGLDPGSLEAESEQTAAAGPSNSTTTAAFVEQRNQGDVISCICPVCQAVLSNRNVLHYHLKYVHAVDNSYEILSKVAVARIKNSNNKCSNQDSSNE